jgi:hypothetical protein
MSYDRGSFDRTSARLTSATLEGDESMRKSMSLVAGFDQRVANSEEAFDDVMAINVATIGR